jgi:hypothetical protein
MPKLSTIALAALLSLYASIQAHAVHVEIDERAVESTQPIWVRTFGEVASSEMNFTKFSSNMGKLKSMHADTQTHKLVAKVWQFNGVLPLIDDGYYLLSQGATKSLKSPCLYELMSAAFCITNSKGVREKYNDESLGKRERRAAITTTQSELKKLSAKDVDDLFIQIDEVISDLREKTSSQKYPPEQYELLGMLKGYLEGLDAHSTVDFMDEFHQGLEHNLVIDKKYGVITVKFDVFSEHEEASKNLYYQILRQLSAIYKDGDAIILDLRNNGGGYLSMALKITQLFLPRSISLNPNSNLITEVDRVPNKNEFKSTVSKIGFVPTRTYDKAPLAVLVNENSASATEIVTSILQDQGRAIVIGNRTYGKGTIQRLVPMIGNRVMMRITTGFYFTNGSTNPQGYGVTPNLMFPLSDEAESSALLESDLPLVIQSPARSTLDLKANPIKKLPETVLACANRISSDRGDSPLRDQKEVLAIAQSVLLRCYGAPDTSVMGMAR